MVLWESRGAATKGAYGGGAENLLTFLLDLKE